MKNENKYNYTEKMYELFNENENVITKHNNLVNKYIADIRDIKSLDKEMISNISTMCNEDKIKIITTYNDMIDIFSDFIATLHNKKFK
jgi:uncharacterized protein YacL (UPF0231 family)